MKADTCIHYNGAINPAAQGICRAGVNYRELAGEGGITGWITRLPCMPIEFRGQGCKATCEKLTFPTAGQIEESEREWKAHLAKVMTAYTGNVRKWCEANKWDRRNPKGATGKVPCEACGVGEIHLSMSAYNGHVHGVCTTEGCVKWME